MRLLYLLPLLAVALIAPSRRRGRHAAPARPRAHRVRPYVPITPAPKAEPIEPAAALVRPYLLAWERRQEQARADATRLGVAVLQDLARHQAEQQRGLDDVRTDLAPLVRTWVEQRDDLAGVAA